LGSCHFSLTINALLAIANSIAHVESVAGSTTPVDDNSAQFVE
jgi:hypothetical protein